MKKVMVFGTFDGLHPGHINFFKQAKKCGDYLVIVIARTANIKKIKGKSPRFSEKERLSQVRAAKIGTKVILGQIKNPYLIIKKEKPSLICLGYDQKGFAVGLAKKFPQIKIRRLRPYKANIYKSSIVNL